MKDKISLAGDLGSGKSTVAKILMEALGAEYYSTGSIVRAIAERMGMTVVELNSYMETHPQIDREIDDGLVKLSEDERALIIDSRMAWHFTKGTFPVYLSTDVETSAARIMNANRKGEHSATLEQTVADTKARRTSEEKRYFEQYGVNINDLTNYALVVDTTAATPEEVAGAILSSLRDWNEDNNRRFCYICPERLAFSDDSADAEQITLLAGALERGECIPEVTVFEDDGDFCVLEGVESAMAYVLNLYTFVPVRLVKGARNGKKYVKMKNSL